jgi:hypothetical protein
MEDPSEKTAAALGEDSAQRPTVRVRLSHLGETTPAVAALVDSGSERTLAGPGLARSLGLDLDECRRASLGIGGGVHRVSFAEVEVELFEDLVGGDPEPVTAWQAEVGFFNSWEPPWMVILGGRGFFDQFTVTMHRAVPAMAVEPYEAFDERFGTLIETRDTLQPRFKH